MDRIQKLRDEDDRRYINDIGTVVERFDDWKPRKSADYKSAYLASLAEIYNIEDTIDEEEAVRFAIAEMQDWLKIYEGSDYVIAKIHACHDFINGEDLFGENYGS